MLQFGSYAHLLFVHEKESVEYCAERKKCDRVKVDCILFYLDVVALSIALVYLLLVLQQIFLRNWYQWSMSKLINRSQI